MVTEDPYAFRFDCGAEWLNLLATRGRAFGARPVERLDSVDRLVAWLRHTELTPRRRPGDADLTLALGLRETLRALALATAEDVPPPPDAVAGLAAFLAAHPDPVALTGGSRLRRKAPADTGEALGRLARQAADTLTGPGRTALRVCPETDCRGVFCDQSGRRRWCPSAACASRGRVRALRARRAGSRTAAR
ncbi:CGNR zinc finger domain-containing protein [Streptomyces sp. NPDC047046]|uniref:CGNR zinc finger domain-containing protein n=1 Tax=Streptomyces sp. NPDC047046 TaxID=3155378 RepID=UPI0033FABCC6